MRWTAAVVVGLAAGASALNGTCPADLKCAAAAGPEKGLPCCQITPSTYECCTSSEGCIAKVGCRCADGTREKGDVPIIRFGQPDSDPTTHGWRVNNDPVMGGQSYSTVNIVGDTLNFTGACKIVPSLKAPGFITVVNSDRKAFVDASKCEGIKVNHMSLTDYKGFRISFGTAHAPGGGFFARGYKADLSAPSVGAFGDAVIPFSSFTDDWNDATGNPVKTCQDNKIYCPTQKSLEDFKTVSLWAEGVEGDITLLVKSISGYNCQ